MVQTESQGQARNVSDNEILLEVKNLKMYFPVTSGILFQRARNTDTLSLSTTELVRVAV